MRTAAPPVCQAFLWGFGEDLFASSPLTRTLYPCIMRSSFSCGTILGQIYQEPLTTKVAHSEYTPPLNQFKLTQENAGSLKCLLDRKLVTHTDHLSLVARRDH